MAAAAAAAVAALVRGMRLQYQRGLGDSFIELEARLGVLSPGGRFQSGVRQEDFTRIVTGLQDYTGWTAPPTPWLETHDYTFKAPSDGTPIRITSAGGTERVLVQKSVLGSEDLVCVPMPRGCFRSPSHYDIRVSVSQERQLSESDVSTQPVTTQYVRIKLRRSFFYKMWRMDVTQAWSGETLQEAELVRKNGVSTNEVEVECIDAAAALHASSDEYLAESLMLKISGMLNAGEVQFELKRG